MPRDFKTILCPTDFSEESGHAIAYGVRFAEISGATILLPHIIHMPTENYYDDRGHVMAFDELRASVQVKLQELRDKYVPDSIRSELICEIGDPYEQLMKLSKDREVDLIVTSTHGRTGLPHLVIGSVAEKIIRHAPCPVFVVRRGVR